MAANREEFYGRPFLPPHVQGEGPRFLAGVDERAGGTWLGVNENGVVAAVTNRPKSDIPEQLRLRGLLCRELLEHRTARDAAEFARQQLATGRYAGANFVVADEQAGWIIEAGDEIRQTKLTAGLHLVTNGVPNDPHDPRQELVRRCSPQSESITYRRFSPSHGASARKDQTPRAAASCCDFPSAARFHRRYWP